MTDPCKNLQTALSNTLQDLRSMSADVIRKSEIYLNQVESLDATSAENLSGKIHQLLQRANENLNEFICTCDAALDDFKETCKNEKPKNVDSPKKKLNLSLNKSDRSNESKADGPSLNETTQKTSPSKNGEITGLSKSEKITSNGEVISSNVMEIESDTEIEIPSLAKNGEIKSQSVHKKEEIESDTDSEKSIRNFDVPVTKSMKDDSDDELTKALLEIDKNDSERDIVLEKPVKSMSFDFDDDDEIATALKKMEETDEVPTSEDNLQKENHALLEMLKKAIGDSSDEIMTENDGDEAAKILDYEMSDSSDSDSDDSILKALSEDNDSSDDWKPSANVNRYDDSDSLGDISDIEMSEDEPDANLEPELKEFSINLQKVDHMNDGEIDRLCDLENINKRKCLKTLNNHKKKRRKRLRILSSSSSSSSSLSSDMAYQTNSMTPDIVIPPEEIPISLPEAPDLGDLADQMANMLDTETHYEVSSDSEPEPEPTKTNKPKKDKIADDLPCDNEEAENETTKAVKTRGSWRNEIFFGSSSDSEDACDVVLNEPVVETIDDEEEKVVGEEDNKAMVKLKIANDGDTMVITDSESNSDSDCSVTFVSESVEESPGAKGRRNIRAIISDNELSQLTQQAKSEEDQRILRIAEHSKNIGSVHSQREEFVLDVDVKTGQSIITVDHNLARMLKPHQKEGVSFMWEACYESVESLKSKPGTGCILAHCMGLGKTLQVIALIHTLFKYPITNTKHVLVICPLSTVTNWKNEFKKALRNVETQIEIKRYFIVKGDVCEKIGTIRTWRKSGGVLVMSYETFTILTGTKLTNRVSALDKQTALSGLVDPGPDLIVCDEGHQLKNDKTLRSKALVQVKTRRRIVLTGTPLQNNLKEYYWMVNFVKPHILGSDKEYMNRFATPITNGQYHDSTPEDLQLMKKRTHVLTRLLRGTIHRVESAILASYLPEILDYTLFIKLSPLQMELYQTYINIVRSGATEISQMRSGYLADVWMLNILNLHPYTLEMHYNKKGPKKKKRTEEGLLEDDEQVPNERIPSDWFKKYLPEDIGTYVDYSPKLRVVLDIVDEATRVGDKILIFAQRRAELDVIENFLKVYGTGNCRTWRQNVDYYRMDGETAIENRDQLCRSFNTTPTAKIFLLTHRVGGLGLNLTGANRAIMIGCNHNPSLDTQSMYRVYRFGQTKKCYIYRLLSLATMEEKIYHRCVVKLHLSGTVVDKLHFTRKITSSDLEEMYKVDFSEYTTDRPIPIVPNDKLLATLLQNLPDINKYYPHSSLLENRPEDELTDADKKSAWEEFNRMEEAATNLDARPSIPFIRPEARPQIPGIRAPIIFPANASYPYNRFGQLPRMRTNTSNIVPNPLNTSARGFLPRLYGHGMPPNSSYHNPPNVIQNHPPSMLRPPQNHPNLHRNQIPSSSRTPQNVPRNQIPSSLRNYPKNVARNQIPSSSRVPQSYSTNVDQNEIPLSSRIPQTNPPPAHQWKRNPEQIANDTLKTLRANIDKLMRNRQTEAEPTGEFNYTLNKFM